MTPVIIIISAALSGATIGVLAVLVVGIRRDDSAKTLTDAPRSRVEAATRRMLGVGVRNPDSGERSGE